MTGPTFVALSYVSSRLNFAPKWTFRAKRKRKYLLCSHRYTTVIAGPTCLNAHLLAPHDRAASQQRTRPHRTPQTPFQHTDDTLYTVEKITAVRWSGGARQWLVRWQGYGEQDDTWEPIENLVGCATFIRGFESRREEEVETTTWARINREKRHGKRSV